MVHRSYDHLSIGGQPTDKETPGWGAPGAARMDRADDDERQVAAIDAQRQLTGDTYRLEGQVVPWVKQRPSVLSSKMSGRSEKSSRLV